VLSLDRLLLGDGGIATALQARGMPLGVLACEWGLSHPEIVRSVHAAYAGAGAGWSTAN
jgi:S-methylmethionine-dependent homocysteine/selenocysteine methylase